ncbi:PKD domain-containing protein [Cellulomonas sp. URHD0024]|uniref:PKD domain-containing protein n=1 Tax=Cellulomonas sp. URHD0024 TaxID=1302620 RepID=UPI000424C13E|nr:PKD domain-containing protein [Cellulomonas sp. URHD0024]
MAKLRRIGGARGRTVVALLACAGVAGAAASFASPSGYPERALASGSGSIWLASSGPGQLALLDGASGEITVRVAVAAPGHDIVAVQGGAAGYALDRTTGGVVRVDAATWEQSAPVDLLSGTKASLDAVTSSDALYAFDRGRGLMVEADPRSLRLRGSVSSLSAVPSPGSPVVDRSGALWMLDARSGDLLRAAHGVVGVTDPAASDAGSGQLLVSDGTPVVVDLASRRAELVNTRTGRLSRASACVDIDPSDDTIQVAAAASTHKLYAVSGRTGVLRTSDLDKGTCRGTVADVAVPGSRLGPPVEVDGTVFVPDYTTGRVVVVRPDEHKVLAVTDAVVAPGSSFDLFSHDGFVFYNERSTEKAGVIELDGQVRAVAKFDASNPAADVQDGADQTPAADAQPAAPDAQPAAPEPAAPLVQPETPADPKARVQAPHRAGTSTHPKKSHPAAPRAHDVQPSAPAPPPPADEPDAPTDLEIVVPAAVVVRQDIPLQVRTLRGSPITTATWSFGDGTPSDSGIALSHRWTRTGSYDISIDVRRASGADEVATATVVVGADARTVTVRRTGGPGTLSAAVAGGPPTECTDTAPCALDASTGAQIELSVSVAGAERLVDWGVPGCDVSSTSCTFPLDDLDDVTAAFGAVATLSVDVSGPGSVQVSPGPPDGGSATCASGRCDWVYVPGTPVTLSAQTSDRFAGWGGGCGGTGGCSLVVADGGASASASFVAVDRTPPTVTLSGGGKTVSIGSAGQAVTFTGFGSTLTVTAVATDPESAVVSTDIYVSIGWSCRNGDIGQNVGPGLVGRPSASSSSGSASFTVSFSGRCQQGWTLSGARASVWATATSEGGTSDETASLGVGWTP